MRAISAAAALMAFSAATALPVSAQTYVVPAGPMMVVQGPIMMEQARAIAFGNGIVMIDDLDFDNFSGRWEIEGRDRWNRDLEMEIDARTGQIVRFDTD